MYRIYKNNRPAGNVKFTTYEQARAAVRRFLRNLTTMRYQGQPDITMALSGYSIRKVA